MAAQILCATNDVDKLFAADSNASLGSRLEFSLNLDMITDHSRTEDIADEPAACEPSVQRPPISRRKTLRRLLSTHVRRTSELHICGGGGGGGEASVSAAQEPETPIKHRQIDVDAQPAAAGFQLELVNLPSPFASFDRGLRCWPDSSHSSAGTASAADADKSSVLTARQLPSRRESIGHRYFYSGIEHEPKEGDEATRDDPEIPVDPDASETPADGTPPQRGRSLMFKPLMDVTAVGALIENIADGKPKSIDEVKPQVAADIKPRAQSNGIRRGIMGSLRRTAAAITTTASNVHSNRRQRSTAKASSAAAGGNEDAEPEVRPLSHKICPIETVQTVQTDEPDASEQQPRANDKDNDNDNDNGSAAQQPVRNVRRRAGTLNLGAARDPIRHDPLKQAPAASGDNASRPLRRRHQSQRIAPRAGSDDALMVPGYIPIAVSLKSTRSRQFLLNTPLGEFEIQRTLGQGSYGKVKLMRSALSHELFAVKIIKRYPPHKHRRGHHEYRKAKTLDRRVVREANLAAILGQLHPHIVPLHDFRVTDTHFYLFYAYVNGVTLAERVGSAGLSEDEARAIFKPVTETIAFCHRYSVIHRDIKLENVLLDYADEGDNARPLLLPREGSKSSRNVVSNANSTGPGSMADAAADPTGARSSADYRAASVFDGRVKLIDFGLANFFDGTSLMETFCGSLPYTAPEILRGDAYVGPEIDVWSLGVLLYVMLTGQFPFEDPAQAKNFDKIMAGDFALRPTMSRELQDLLVRMLQPNAKRRITMKAVLHHPWLMSPPADHAQPPAPGICCRLHPYATADAIHDRRTLLLPGPAISHLVAREVATCLDRSFDDVLRILEAAVANGKQHQASERVQANGNIYASLPQSAVQQWPHALQEFYSGNSLVQVPNSPVVSVYALVLQQISMRRYYLELPATDEGAVKGQSSSSATMELLQARNNASTLSSSSHLTGLATSSNGQGLPATAMAMPTASGGLRDMLESHMPSVPVSTTASAFASASALASTPASASASAPASASASASAQRSRTLMTRLASHLGNLGNLVSATLGATTEDLQPPQHWQQAHPSSAAKLKSARALTALELTQSAVAPASPVYVQPLSTGVSMPSLTSHKQPTFASRMRSVRSRSRQSLPPSDNDESSNLRVRTLAAAELPDSRISLPADLASRPPAHVLGLLSSLLKLHEIAHTFVETRRMPVHRALDSSAFPLKTMAAVVASAYPAAQQMPSAETSANDGESVYVDAQSNTAVNNEGCRQSGDAAAQTSGTAPPLRSLLSLFSRPQQQQTPAAVTDLGPSADTPALARSRRRLTQLPAQLREKVHRRPTQKYQREQQQQPRLDKPAIVHPPHIQQAADSSTQAQPPREIVTTTPVKHATPTIFAQYSPSLNRMRETEVLEYYSCSVRIELVRICSSSNLRQPRYRYALLVERMTGHKGKYALFRIFLQRMVAALPSLSPEPLDPRPATDPSVTVL